MFGEKQKQTKKYHLLHSKAKVTKKQAQRHTSMIATRKSQNAEV